MRSCVNCKYSRDVGPYLACYAQKNAPRVDWDDVCKDWKPEHATNADRIRATTNDEELAVYLFRKVQDIFDHRFFCCSDMLEWLQQEADNGD